MSQPLAFQTAPQFVRHIGIAAPFMQSDVEGEYIAPVGAELHDLHGPATHSMIARGRWSRCASSRSHS